MPGVGWNSTGPPRVEAISSAGKSRGLLVGLSLRRTSSVAKCWAMMGLSGSSFWACCEQGVGLGVVAVQAGLGGELDELGEALLAGDDEGERVVAVAGGQLHGALKASSGRLRDSCARPGARLQGRHHRPREPDGLRAWAEWQR